MHDIQMFADFKLNNNMQCHFEHHRNKKKMQVNFPRNTN